MVFIFAPKGLLRKSAGVPDVIHAAGISRPALLRLTILASADRPAPVSQRIHYPYPL
jgi:hypothetical protein